MRITLYSDQSSSTAIKQLQWFYYYSRAINFHDKRYQFNLYMYSKDNFGTTCTPFIMSLQEGKCT